MKKALLVLLLLSKYTFVFAQQTCSDTILKEFLYHPEHILVTAHRSAHQKYPENSLAAMHEAIAIGVDIIELDVRQTKDGRLIIMHNPTVDHTTNGKGEVSSYTYAELRKLRLLFDGKPTDQQVPTLEEALQTTKGRIMVDIDFKLDDQEAKKATYHLIQQYQMQKQVLFFVYTYKDLSSLYKLDNAVMLMPRAYNQADVMAILKYGFVKVVHIDDTFYSEPLMKTMRNAGVRVWSNALGHYDDMEELSKNSGFDDLLKGQPQTNVIQTNLPAELLAYLKLKGLHR